ncbi:MAG: hypothetical protein ABSH41_11445 [Syntrophobacteraceae bacterium]|jgi:hypothetical protein
MISKRVLMMLGFLRPSQYACTAMGQRSEFAPEVVRVTCRVIRVR